VDGGPEMNSVQELEVDGGHGLKVNGRVGGRGGARWRAGRRAGRG
jgi:hypothetical protein